MGPEGQGKAGGRGWQEGQGAAALPALRVARQWLGHGAGDGDLSEKGWGKSLVRWGTASLNTRVRADVRIPSIWFLHMALVSC